MNLDGIFHRQHIGFVETSQLAFKPSFVCRHELVSHGFAGLPPDVHQCLGWIGPARIARQRHNHYPGQISVGGIVADDDRRPGFLDFRTQSWIEFNPPDFTSLH